MRNRCASPSSSGAAILLTTSYSSLVVSFARKNDGKHSRIRSRLAIEVPRDPNVDATDRKELVLFNPDAIGGVQQPAGRLELGVEDDGVAVGHLHRCICRGDCLPDGILDRGACKDVFALL